jgi:hypothetical protein
MMDFSFGLMGKILSQGKNLQVTFLNYDTQLRASQVKEKKTLLQTNWPFLYYA